MKKLALMLAAFLLLTLCVGCGEAAPDETKAPAATVQTGAEPSAPVTAEPAVHEPQPVELSGSWRRTHTEVEGDKNQNTNASLVITGDTVQTMTVTYDDSEFPEDSFGEKSLCIREGELYPGCGNGSWYAEVAPTGEYAYCLTLLEDGTLLMQCSFAFDGQPMLSYQWFARSR